MSLILDLKAQKTSQITGLQSIHLQPIQLYRRNFPDSDAADVRIGQRDAAQPGSEELRTGEAAFGKDDLLETALRKGSAGEVAAGEAHVPHARLRKTGILRTAALCRNILQRRLGKRGSREAAVDKTDTKKAGAGKIGHREVAVAENNIGQMGVPPHHSGKAASGETAARDGKMVAGKSRESPPRKARPETSSPRARRSGVPTGKAAPESCGSAILISGFIRYRPACNPPRGASKD